MSRAGQFVQQPTGYKAFIPKPLPPEPQLNMNSDIQMLLSEADRCIGKLDGITDILPNPDLFVAMYVKKEAVLSSQIEGTQASLLDVLEADEDINSAENDKHVEEIVNYIYAMNYGLKRLQDLPLSLRLIREIHKHLLDNVRGGERDPGEFRKTQNWIGPAGSTLSSAVFVPPPVPEMENALGELEIFIHEHNAIPPLIKIGLIHAQFETIHPFLDGNGRMGRLLITFWLCQQHYLERPLLYLSYYFKKYRSEYYDRLMDIRIRGDWESWIMFFLRGIIEVSNEAINTSRKIIHLKESHSRMINNHINNPANGLKLLEYLYENPVTTVKKVQSLLDVTYPTANTLISTFCNLHILSPTDSKQRYRKFIYHAYVKLLEPGTEIAPQT